MATTQDLPVVTGRRTSVIVLAAGSLVAIAANSIVAIAAHAAGASATFSPLLLPVYGAFSVLGLVAAFIGWNIVRRRAKNPRAVLRVLVPVLIVLSYIPDSVLLATGFIPGSSVTAVVALALMHLVVVGVAVPICLRLSPVRTR